ncbi:hypothetical protein H8356DRAFT_1323970 [Neocallimastix lanati (nom. inval.)]|nr:hypothetical protein H8356DRAFT_1323970 [Neocallimastix sp. JGI-2020a]
MKVFVPLEFLKLKLLFYVFPVFLFHSLFFQMLVDKNDNIEFLIKFISSELKYAEYNYFITELENTSANFSSNRYHLSNYFKSSVLINNDILISTLYYENTNYPLDEDGRFK